MTQLFQFSHVENAPLPVAKMRMGILFSSLIVPSPPVTAWRDWPNVLEPVVPGDRHLFRERISSYKSLLADSAGHLRMSKSNPMMYPKRQFVRPLRTIYFRPKSRECGRMTGSNTSKVSIPLSFRLLNETERKDSNTNVRLAKCFQVFTLDAKERGIVGSLFRHKLRHCRGLMYPRRGLGIEKMRRMFLSRINLHKLSLLRFFLRQKHP